MKTNKDLENAERAIKTAEARSEFIKAHMTLVDIEINTLSALETQLIENIDVLKEHKIVAVATAFQKAKTDLTKTRNELKRAKDQFSKLSKSHKNALTVLLKCREAYDIIYSRSINNVVVGNFRRNNNGQR